MKYLGMIIDENCLIVPTQLMKSNNFHIIHWFNLGLVFKEFAEKIQSLSGSKDDITVCIIGNLNNEKYFYKVIKK